MKYIMLDEKVKEDENRDLDYFFNAQLHACCQKYGLRAVVVEYQGSIGSKAHNHDIKTVGWLGGKIIATVYCPYCFDENGRFAKKSNTTLSVKVRDHTCYDTIQKIMDSLTESSIKKEEQI
jgi:hypothetical protein